MKSGTHPSPFAALSFIDSKKRYPFTAGLTERVFQSSDGEAWARSHDFWRLLHHNRVTLTTRQRRFSKEMESVIKARFQKIQTTPSFSILKNYGTVLKFYGIQGI